MESLRRHLSGIGGNIRQLSEGEHDASGSPSDNNSQDIKRQTRASADSMHNASSHGALTRQLVRAQTSAETGPQDSPMDSRGLSRSSSGTLEGGSTTSLTAKCKKMVKKTLRSLRSLSVRSLTNRAISTKALDTKDLEASADQEKHGEDNPPGAHVSLHENINSLLMTELCGGQETLNSQLDEDQSRMGKDSCGITKQEQRLLLSSQQSLTHSETVPRSSRTSSRVTFLIPTEASELGALHNSNLNVARLSSGSSSRGLISDTGKLFAYMAAGSRSNHDDDCNRLVRMYSGGVPHGSGSLFTARASVASNEDSGSSLPLRSSLKMKNSSSHKVVVAQERPSHGGQGFVGGSRLITTTTTANSLQSNIPQMQASLAPYSRSPMTSFSNMPYDPKTAQNLLSSGIQYSPPALRHCLGTPGLSNHSLAQQLQHKRGAMYQYGYKNYPQIGPQNNATKNINNSNINNINNANSHSSSNLHNGVHLFKIGSRLPSSSLNEAANCSTFPNHCIETPLLSSQI